MIKTLHNKDDLDEFRFRGSAPYDLCRCVSQNFYHFWFVGHCGFPSFTPRKFGVIFGPG